MKKFLIASLVILLMAGTAGAANIPRSIDSKAGPEVWITSIYNNDTNSLSVGDVVVWDIANSTGDNDNYVVDTTTVDTYIVAGVIWGNTVGVGSRGLMAIKGVALVDVTEAVDEGSLLCASDTDGEAQVCSDSTDDANAFGFATVAFSSTTGNAFIFGR